MHDPVRLLAVRGTTFVENQRLPHPYALVITVDNLVPPGGLPEPGSCSPIGARASWVLFVFVTEEVPIVLWGGSYSAFLCSNIDQ